MNGKRTQQAESRKLPRHCNTHITPEPLNMDGSCEPRPRARAVVHVHVHVHVLPVQLACLLTKNKRDDTEGGERYNTGTEYKRAESVSQQLQ